MISHEPFNMNQMEQHAKELALSHNLVKKPGPDRLLARLAENEKTLIKTCKSLSSAMTEQNLISPSAEWFLDNFYLIEEHIRITKRYLPKKFEKKLPQLANGPLQGYPRVYEIARHNVMHHDGYWDLETLSHFILAYQSITMLTIGELWAIPIMLRLTLIENLRHLSVRIAADERDRNFPNNGENEITEIAKQQAVDQGSVRNSIASLRRLDKTDWREFVEKLSVVEQILRQDPADIYSQMDCATRSRYAQVIERLASASSYSEEDVATITHRLADLADESVRHRHVGFYLMGAGLNQLEQAIQLPRSILESMRRLITRHLLFNYLGLIALITFALSLGILFKAAQGGMTTVWFIILGFSAILATSQLAVSLVNGWATVMVKPQALPKMDFSKGIACQWRTLVDS